MKPKWTATVAHSPQAKNKYARPHLEIWAEDADMTVEDARIAQHARELLGALEKCLLELGVVNDIYSEGGNVDEYQAAVEKVSFDTAYYNARAAIRKARGEQ